MNAKKDSLDDLFGPRKGSSETREQMRKSIESVGSRTKQKVEDENGTMTMQGTPWGSYGMDAKKYLSRFADNFENIATLPKRLAARHERGEHVLVVDVCGVADAKSIGADHTIGFTLQKFAGIPDTESRTIVAGDIFVTKDVNRLMRAIDAQNTPVSCVFMSPIAGLLKYGEHVATHVKLYALLSKLYTRMAQDGDIYADILDFPYSAAILANSLNRLSSKPFCETNQISFRDVRGQSSTAVATIHIFKHRDAPRSLPSIDQLPLSDEDLARLSAMKL
ncbi:MAG: hypothetical protein AAB665_01400 [Patescibacteria group bacterium]